MSRLASVLEPSSRRRAATLRVAAIVVVAILTSSGCVRSERSLGPEPGLTKLVSGTNCLDPLKTAKGKVRLEVWHGIVAQAKETLGNLAKEFNASQDKVEVVIQSQGTSYEQLRRAYFSAIAGGGLPGLLHADVNDLQVLIDTKTLLPAQTCFDAEAKKPEVFESIRSAFTVDGKYWTALPTVNSYVLYYNKVQFAKAGLDVDDPPKTLDELTVAARALKRVGVDKPLSFLLQPGLIEYWAAGSGEQLVNHGNGRESLATESNFDNPATHKVFRWIDQMQREGLMAAFSTGGIDQFVAVATQKSAMLIETSTASTTIAQFLNGETVDGAGDIDPTDLPLQGLVPAAGQFPGIDRPGDALIGGGAFYIPSTNPPEIRAAAWAFSQFMASKQGQTEWHMQGSYLPISEAAADSSELAKFWESGLAGGMLKVATDQMRSIPKGATAPVVGPREDYGKIVEGAMSRVVFQGEDPDRAVAEAQKELSAALAQYAKDNAR